MNKTIKIGNFTLDDQSPTFVIAEAGVNHNGDLDTALELIREAHRIGVDCIKFQTFKAKRVIVSDAPKAEYQLETTDPAESQLAMLQKLELGLEHYQAVIDLCNELGILFISTPYNPEDVDFLDDLGVPAFKLASIHIVEPSLLQYVARKGKPMIISTGMATLAEVDVAVRAIREAGNEQFVILQCTTNYPTENKDVNLKAMVTMRDAFDAVVGYSDHTQSNIACCASVALGGRVIEKHFTLDKNMEGPDHSSSADPDEFEKLIEEIRSTEAVLGHGLKTPAAAEVRNIAGMRRSLVANRAIQAGEIIMADMLTFKRPGTGLKPSLIDDVIGRVAVKDIAPDEVLQWEMCGHTIQN